MNDQKLDSLLAEAFGELHAPEELAAATADAVRKASFVPAKRLIRTRLVAAIAACLVLLAAIPSGIYLYNDVTTVVSIDVNPSVELSLNRFDRVLSARGANDDGAALLASVPVVGLDCEEAVRLLLADESIRQAASEANRVEIVVASLSDGDTSAIQEKIRSASAAASCPCNCSSATADELQAANEAGLTGGKYRAYTALQEAGIDISLDEVRSMTMHELHELADEHGIELEHDQNQGGNAEHGSGNGQGNEHRTGRP